MRRDVFHAISDPTRRQIIHLLSKEKLNLNSIAEQFEISRPAISKHIRILNECGLIRIRQKGRERFCEANLNSLHDVASWVEKYKIFWTARLDSLERHLASGYPDNYQKKPLKRSK